VRELSVVSLLLLPGIAWAQGYPPKEAAFRMTLPEGFAAQPVASEPQIRQPAAIDFDDRGRLWVMQYLQYPNPAGLARVQVDRFSRTKYDRIPEPPPRGPQGEDRLTILQADARHPDRLQAKDFVAGLNLASSFQFGHGGVYILNPPYLLFYPDHDGDDVPDATPDVLLTGFGMDDAHSVANSLTWGPDGWLYGCQGSTVTSNIRNIEFQQGVWRYHPKTREFELFCEGGGNSWGLDFDDDGNLLYSTNHGGFVMLHGVPGAYLWKQFGKHGELHNPFAYGYFDHVPHQNFFGGHVTVGGIVYRGHAYPEKLRGKYVAGDLLGHGVYWHDMEPRGTTFQTRHGGQLLVANDTWFATSDVCLGPDGCIYVADWHDKRTAHPDPDADWDRSNGRVYRIAYGQQQAPALPDLAHASSNELVGLLLVDNHWLASRARRVLAERRDAATYPRLRTILADAKDEHEALKALWALDVGGGFDEELGRRLLEHHSPLVRRWTVRLLGDRRHVEPATADKLSQLAQEESRPHVRSQLACTARRLAVQQALPILKRLALRVGDERDPYIPLLLWWGIEQHCVAGQRELCDFITTEPAQKSPLVKETILPRLVRRYVATGDQQLDEAVATIVSKWPSELHATLLDSIEIATQQRPAGKAALTPSLVAFLERQFQAGNPAAMRTLARNQHPAAARQAVEMILDPKSAESERVSLLPLLPQMQPAVSSWSAVEKLLAGSESEPVKLATLAALAQVRMVKPAALLNAYPVLTARERAAARTALFSRADWAAATLAAVAAGKLAAKDFAVEELRPVAAHGDPALDALVRQYWGKIDPPTKEEILADVRRFNNDLRAFAGDIQAGKLLFAKNCGVCHKLFGEGGAVGPDLTFANRSDRDYLLISTVDPSAVIRKEFASYTVLLRDGAIRTGVIGESTPDKVTLIDGKAQKIALLRSQIDKLEESSTSLMPDNLLKQLQPQELRDLFAYLQSPQKPTEP
jgi:putative membrane-bound dehydrogenase-like protein